MTPEEAKASLGVATNLVDNFLMSQQEMGRGEAVGQQMDTGQPDGRQTEGQPVEQSEQSERPEQPEDKTMLEDIKKTIQSEIKKEISGLRGLIEEALNEEEDSEDSKDKEDAED